MDANGNLEFNGNIANLFSGNALDDYLPWEHHSPAGPFVNNSNSTSDLAAPCYSFQDFPLLQQITLAILASLLTSLVAEQPDGASQLSSTHVEMTVYTEVRNQKITCGPEFYKQIWSPVHNDAMHVDFVFQVPKACFVVEFRVQGLSIQENDRFFLLLRTSGRKQYISCTAELLGNASTIRSKGIPMRDHYTIKVGGRKVRKTDPFFHAKGVGIMKLLHYPRNCPFSQSPQKAIHVIASKRICIRSQQSASRNVH
jgi:hypothetical protein